MAVWIFHPAAIGGNMMKGFERNDLLFGGILLSMQGFSLRSLSERGGIRFLYHPPKPDAGFGKDAGSRRRGLRRGTKGTSADSP